MARIAVATLGLVAASGRTDKAPIVKRLGSLPTHAALEAVNFPVVGLGTGGGNLDSKQPQSFGQW